MSEELSYLFFFFFFLSLNNLDNTEAEAPILWPPDTKSWLIEKYLDAGKYCG